jgi:primosomal protein DnaI
MKKEMDLTKHTKNVSLYNISSSLRNAKVKDIYTDDKSRIEIILYINDYISSYFKDRKKGVYLTGNFGSGKTYLIAALFNELAKKDVKCAICYFPEFLRTLKESFKELEEGVSYSDKFNYIKKIPLLLIDDIGAENLSTWARDEILGSILQYRMEENLSTFFTSNLTLDELESHLAMAGSKVDKVKARRIIERIKYLTTEMTLIGVDRRN